MDAKQALADLTEISSQIRSAVLLSDDGMIAGSTLDDEQAERMAKAAQALLEAAERTRPGPGPRTLTQLEASTLGGSVFVVRDHGRVIAATTSPEPTVGLVFYDLKSCLRNASDGGGKAQEPQASKTRVRAKPAEKESPPKPARRRTTKKKDDGAA